MIHVIMNEFQVLQQYMLSKKVMLHIRKIRKHLNVFHFSFYLKHIKDMESRSISGVSSTCRNPCRSPFRHSKEDMAYICNNIHLVGFKQQLKMQNTRNAHGH